MFIYHNYYILYIKIKDCGIEMKGRKILLSGTFILVILILTNAASATMMNVMVGDDDGLKVISAKKPSDDFINKVLKFKTWIETTRPFKDLKLSQEEINVIKTNINNIVESLNTLLKEYGLDPVNPERLYREMFESELGRSTIISVGIGYALIPFYDYDTFIGLMFRPIWLWYPPIILGGGGYTGNLNVNVLPPRIEFGDRLGSHLVRTTLFSGLYINIGDIGRNNVFGGLMLMIGRAYVVMN